MLSKNFLLTKLTTNTLSKGSGNKDSMNRNHCSDLSYFVNAKYLKGECIITQRG